MGTTQYVHIMLQYWLLHISKFRVFLQPSPSPQSSLTFFFSGISTNKNDNNKNIYKPATSEDSIKNYKKSIKGSQWNGHMKNHAYQFDMYNYSYYRYYSYTIGRYRVLEWKRMWTIRGIWSSWRVINYKILSLNRYSETFE